MIYFVTNRRWLKMKCLFLNQWIVKMYTYWYTYLPSVLYCQKNLDFGRKSTLEKHPKKTNTVL